MELPLVTAAAEVFPRLPAETCIKKRCTFVLKTALEVLIYCLCSNALAKKTSETHTHSSILL